VKRRYVGLILSVILGFSEFGFVPGNVTQAAIDCTTYPTNLDGRCLNQAYFSGIDFGASITNGGYGSTGVFANAGAPNAGNLCATFQDTDADISGASECGLWKYVDPLGSDGLDKWAIPDTVENGKAGAAQAFVNFIGDYLNATEAGCSFNAQFIQPSTTIPSYGTCQYYRARMIGASYIVLTTLGGQYTTYDVGNLFDGQINGATGPYNDVQAGILDARAEYTKWSNEILAADASGTINWDTPAPPSISASNHTNTSAVDWNHDIEMREEAPQARHSIIIDTPTGQIVINRRCGNTNGFSVLAPAGYTMNLSANAITPSVPAGQLATISLVLNNNGPNSSSPGRLQVQYPGAASVTAPCGGSCGDPNQGALNFGDTGHGYTSGSGPPTFPGGANWYWTTASFPNGATASAQLSFAIPITASPGPLTLDVYYNPGDDSGTTLHSTVTINITTITTYPSVLGLNSDIHAENSACSVTPGAGGVLGNPNAGSYGDYVISTPGGISDFASNGGTNAGTDLSLGQLGGYSQICRNDLYNYATSNMPPAAVPLTGPAYDIGSAVFNSSPGVTFVNVSGSNKAVAYISGPVDLHGDFNEPYPLTIVVTGDVTISSNLTRSGGGGRSTASSVAIIASGSIFIKDAATQVDAMLISDDTIYTCDTGAPVPAVGQCDNTLTVNGFLMAKDIHFERLGS
jgi:hypothetical protein